MEYLERAGISTETGERYSISHLEIRLRIAPSYLKLFRTLIHILESDDLLRIEGGEAIFGASQVRNQGPLLRVSLEQEFPAFREDIEVIGRVMAAYPQVLSGEANPKAILFPAGNYDALMPLFRNRMKLTDAEAYVALAADCVLELANSFERRPVRILEIGGGEGMLTWPVIEKLRGRAQFEYVFTDIGRSFVLRTEREARRLGIEEMSFQTFDFLEEGSAQGLIPGSFDLILAFNVVHVAADIRSAVRNLQALLTPSGCLCLLEGTTISAADDDVLGAGSGLVELLGSGSPSAFAVSVAQCVERGPF